MLELVNVKKTYVTKAGQTIAVNGINLKFADKGLVFITGKSGCGKTTLLNLIGGLDNFDSGDIIIDGKKFSEFSPADYDSYRNTLVGFVFQEYNLLNEYTIEKNVTIANELQGKKTEGEDLKQLFETVDMSRFMHRMPNQLSGGQKQRVAIARALVKNPRIVLADEPTGALDSATGIQVMELLKELAKDKLIIIVSHENDFAEKYADRIIRIVDGQVVEDITINELEVRESVYDTPDELVVKSGADLTEEDSRLLAGAIKNKKKINITEKISVRYKEKTKEIKQDDTKEPVSFIKSKMKFKSVLGMGLKSLSTKPIRLIFTILLSVIAFAVFGLFDSVASYNGELAIRDMLRNSGYNAISVYGTYNNANYHNASLMMTQDYINSLSKETGYSFRGVYDIFDYEEYSNNKDRSNYNRSIMISGIDKGFLNINGKQYYKRSMTGIIEFSEREIRNNIISEDGFNYKVVYGKYPTLNVNEDEKQGVGISTYMAESLMFWLHAYDNDTSPEEFVYDGKTIRKMEDFIGTRLRTINGTKIFIIEAIIDCGAIPSKFDHIKDKKDIPAEQLYDFETFLNAGAYLNIFAPSGYIDYSREQTGRKVAYVGDYKTIDYFASAQGYEYKASSYFYNNNEFDGNNTILFDDLEEEKQIGATPTLSANEVIINVNDLRRFIDKEISIAQHKVQSNTLIPLIEEAIVFLKDNENTIFEKRKVLKDVLDMIEQIYDITGIAKPAQRTLTLMATTDKVVSQQKEFVVKGIYLGVDTDSVLQDKNNYYPLLLSGEGLANLNVNQDQGIYTRAIAPLTGGYFEAKTLGNLLVTNDNAFTIRWYKNGLFDIIGSNQQTISELANLFLYIALVIVAFSVFMLFNYISTSIAHKRQTIGILRALGTRSKSIFEMFLIESLIIALISGIFACVVASVACVFVNEYMLGIIKAGIRFALFGVRQILIIIFASLATGALASLLPISKIVKEKPVALIRKE